MTPADLRARRAALGLSQRALADRLGVTQGTLSRWEAGERVIEHAAMLTLALDRLADTPQQPPHERAAALLHGLYPALVERRDPDSGLVHRAYNALSRNEPAGIARALFLAERVDSVVGRAVVAVLRAGMGTASFADATCAVQDVWRAGDADRG